MSCRLHFGLLLLVLGAFCCDFIAKVHVEQSSEDVFAQFTFHNETRSELFILEPFAKPIEFHIVGSLCNLKPTTLKVWKIRPENPDIPPAGMSFGFLEGMGEAIYTIYGTLPKMVSRAGVFCGFGDCGGHGK